MSEVSHLPTPIRDLIYPRLYRTGATGPVWGGAALRARDRYQFAGWSGGATEADRRYQREVY